MIFGLTSPDIFRNLLAENGRYHEFPRHGQPGYFIEVSLEKHLDEIHLA